MKKRAILLLAVLVAAILLLFPAMTLADAGDAAAPSGGYTYILIESAAEVAATLLIMLIGVLGTWLTLKIGKRKELANINAAQQEVITLARQTVGELQQTVVDGLKASHADGKLTIGEIRELGNRLVELTKAKMSAATEALLSAAAVDIAALIRGAGEDWIQQLKE